ncbi:HK97 family phage prohead protease [Pseudomonas sp. MSSRFD41]|uniref:HK97 family phage prohead protease n=1 Tax=Pseudomonas sp. MSSRFD41 TaxID=1310370 RepID=UPI0016397633|nr:HK97 family phage prohead protease [Pseudomonas sp. MSSRFD41]MBC2655086.1 HK97 family phage prohead protease [Pseudomonas sp. MSSRFD41]
MSDFEKRMLPAQLCELRAVQPTGDGAQDQPPRIAGYGAVFNQRSELLGGLFVEIIAPGAFDDVLAQDVRGLFNHDPNYLLGRTVSGTLRLSVDQRGLAYEIDTPNTQTIRDLVVEPLKRGDMSGSSFAMRVAPGGDTWHDENGVVVRTIYKIAELRDVGPVSFPAYPDSSAAQRSMDAWKQAQKEGLEGRAQFERDARERLLDLNDL